MIFYPKFNHYSTFIFTVNVSLDCAKNVFQLIYVSVSGFRILFTKPTKSIFNKIFIKIKPH